MNKEKLNFKEYAKAVAEKLNIESAERLETIYGDLIQDCYDMGDTVSECSMYCNCDDEEFEDSEESRFN